MFWIWGSGWGKGRSGRQSRKTDFQPIEQAEETRITSDMSPAEVELRIRRRIERRHAERSGFVGSVVAYVIVNAVLWSIFSDSRGFYFWGMPWPLFVTFFWGINLLRRGYSLYQNAPERVARRENYIQSEVDRMKARLGFDERFANYTEKPKNDEKPKRDAAAAVHLTADGELAPDEAEFAPFTDDFSDDRQRYSQSDLHS